VRLFKAENIPPPPLCLCWNLIPKNKKLALEIGAGSGLFSLEFARENPDWFLLSMERTANKYARFLQLKKNFPPLQENLYFLRADGVNVVTHWVPPHSIDRLFLLYPNPHPKAKQANLRWHNMIFFEELLKRLKPDGVVELRTNLEWYLREFKEKVRSENLLIPETERLLPKDHPPQTAFEKKYLARGENCFQLILKKSKALTDS